MLRYIIGISLITLVLIILRKVMGDRISKTLRYSLWIIVPLYMVIAPFYSIDVAVPSRVKVVSEQTNQMDMVTNDMVTNDMVTNADFVPVPLGQQNNSDMAVADDFSAKNSIQIDWIKTIKYAYISITALVIIGISVYNMGFIFYCRRKRNFIETNSCGLKVYNIDHSSAPFLLGNKIYLMDSITEDMRKFAICHEYCHYKHGDMFWNVIRYLVLAVNFYNPIVWYAFVLSEQDCELACDESVLKMFGSEQSAEYGKVLLNLLANKSLGKHDFYLSTTMHGRNKRFMKERIVSIKNSRQYGIVPVCLTIAIAIATTGCSLIKTKSIDKEVAAHNAEVAQVEAEIENAVGSNETIVVAIDASANELDEPAEPEATEETEETAEAESIEISSLPDGMYTVAMSNIAWVDGVQACGFYPWTQLEFDQDYIDNLEVGDKIDISNCGYGYIDEDGNINYYEELEVTELTSSRCNPGALYGTEYDGSVLIINSDHLAYLMKVADSDSWKLFNCNDTPFCVVGEEMYIKLSDDISMYDGFSVFATYDEEIALTYEEKRAIAEFKDKEHLNIINSISDLIGFENSSFSDYTVINVVNNEVTEMYFWYHP